MSAPGSGCWKVLESRPAISFRLVQNRGRETLVEVARLRTNLREAEGIIPAGFNRRFLRNHCVCLFQRCHRSVKQELRKSEQLWHAKCDRTDLVRDVIGPHVSHCSGCRCLSPLGRGTVFYALRRFRIRTKVFSMIWLKTSRGILFVVRTAFEAERYATAICNRQFDTQPASLLLWFEKHRSFWL